MSKSYLIKQYSKWGEFWKLAEIFDPNNLFDNRFLSELRLKKSDLEKVSLSESMSKELKRFKLL